MPPISDGMIHAIGGTIIVCSILHSTLPPWDFLNDFPTLQKYYKLLIYVIGYVALNARSTVYKSISTTQPTQPPQSGVKPN